jgi:regulator of extracellular matrix RemA (YlzA/DUF370 family)
MNAQNRLTPMKKVVHQADERPKSVDAHGKCSSSSRWTPKIGWRPWKMSFIKPMNAQNRLTPMKKVVHQAYERPKSVDAHEKSRSSSLWTPKIGWNTWKMSFIEPMNNKNRLTPMKKVVHQADERQKLVDAHEKRRSSSRWTPKIVKSVCFTWHVKEEIP